MEELSDMQSSQDTNSDVLSSKGVEDEPRQHDLAPNTSKAPLAITNAPRESHGQQQCIAFPFLATSRLMGDIDISCCRLLSMCKLLPWQCCVVRVT